VSGSVLASKPSKQVPVVEIEGNEGLAKKFGSLANRECGVVGLVPRQAKEMQWCPRQLHSRIAYGLSGGARMASLCRLCPVSQGQIWWPTSDNETVSLHVLRCQLGWPKPSMMLTISAPCRERPSTSCGTVAGDLAEFKAGALECFEGSLIQERQWKAADTLQEAIGPGRIVSTTGGRAGRNIEVT
jgi:hypothetical protein